MNVYSFKSKSLTNLLIYTYVCACVRMYICILYIRMCIHTYVCTQMHVDVAFVCARLCSTARDARKRETSKCSNMH